MKIDETTVHSARQHHYPVLDGVRGIAILMVLIFHFWQGMVNYHFSMNVRRLLSICIIGQKGVDLFFVLSGFLITAILLRSKNSPCYFTNFYMRRALRIFPLYYLVVFGCLAVGSICSAPNYDWSKMWWYILYLQNIAQTFWPHLIAGPGHFWSLAVEEHYYLFWPLLVFWLSSKTLAKVSILLIVASFVIRCALVKVGYDVFPFTLCRMDSLAAGSFIAIIFMGQELWPALIKCTRVLLLPLGLLSFASFFILNGTGSAFLQCLKFILFALLCGGAIVIALSSPRSSPLVRVLSFGWLRGLGKTSYAMYVFHPFLFKLIIGQLLLASWSPVKGRQWPALVLEFAAAMTATIVVSKISWFIVEQPFLNLKRNFKSEPIPVKGLCA